MYIYIYTLYICVCVQGRIRKRDQGLRMLETIVEALLTRACIRVRLTTSVFDDLLELRSFRFFAAPSYFISVKPLTGCHDRLFRV